MRLYGMRGVRAEATESGEGQARAAEELAAVALAADLRALVDAGFVAPMTDPAGAVRYAPIEPGLREAA